jgi:shikimate kinase
VKQDIMPSKKVDVKNKNIVLIGLMGSGKSSSGLALAKMLKRPIYSMDQMIEEQEGKTIGEIFEAKGESYFRQLERDLVKVLSTKKESVIDCGGGVFINEDNRKDLKKTGLIIYLSASVETLYNRVKTRTHRPLLKVEDPKKKLEKLLREREKFYQEADLTFLTDGKTPQDVAKDIMKVLRS